MMRKVPVQLLDILENICSQYYSWSTWNDVIFWCNSNFRYELSVVAFLFAVYLDDLGKMRSSISGCY